MIILFKSTIYDKVKDKKLKKSYVYWCKLKKYLLFCRQILFALHQCNTISWKKNHKLEVKIVSLE